METIHADSCSFISPGLYLSLRFLLSSQYSGGEWNWVCAGVISADLQSIEVETDISTSRQIKLYFFPWLLEVRDGWIISGRFQGAERCLREGNSSNNGKKKNKKNFWEFFTTSLLWNAIYARNILKYFGTLSMWSRLIRDVWRALREVKEGLRNKKSWERLQFIKVMFICIVYLLGLCGDKWCFINVDVVIGCSILILFGFFFQFYITSFPAVVQYKTTVLDSRQ